jgi:HlyD family secretion protein
MKKQAKIAVAVVAITAFVLALVITNGFGMWEAEDDTGLTLHGNVDIREVELGFRIPGRIVEMPIEEGTRVPAGALLARLDTRPLEDNLAAANARIAANQAELAKRRGGNRTQEISQAGALVSERRATIVRLQAEVNRRQSLVRTGAVSRAEFEESIAEFKEAQARLRSAEQGLSLQRAGSRP